MTLASPTPTKAATNPAASELMCPKGEELAAHKDPASLESHKEAAVRCISLTNQSPQLTTWPSDLCQLTQLTAVNLSGNAITSIPGESLQQLQSLQQLLLSRNQLQSLPTELGALTALTELDVGSNRLQRLPDTLCNLTNLKVLNAWGNQLTSLPDDFGQLQQLVRLGLKGNQLAQLPDSFTQLTSLVELFLTDNKLTTLPAGFGNLSHLVKLQASYNPFESLPDDLWQLPHLELFRLAVGHLKAWPAQLGGLPRLAWCSIGSNPAAAEVPPLPDLPRVHTSDLSMGSKLGQGASGEVFTGVYEGEPVAVKIFLAGASPDGSTQEEIGITCQNKHPNLTQVVAVVVGASNSSGGGCGDSNGGDTHGDEQITGLVMKLVNGKPMADRPTSQHLLRCKWPEQPTYSSSQVAAICSGLTSALSYLHSRGVCHGDLYAHNIMLEGDTHAVLCDFGAAFCYDPAAGGFWEAMEVRAFGLFMQGLCARVDDSTTSQGASQSSVSMEQLQALVEKCLAEQPSGRPSFAKLQQQLDALLG